MGNFLLALDASVSHNCCSEHYTDWYVKLCELSLAQHVLSLTMPFIRGYIIILYLAADISISSSFQQMLHYCHMTTH